MQSMIDIDGRILSTDILTEPFCCDLTACRGACCVEGDAGAPLDLDEVDMLEEEFDTYRPYMTPEGIAEIERTGFMTVDREGDYTTPLVDGGRCAYAFEEGGTTFCAVERAFRLGKTAFCKPRSCHLYPIRVKEFADGSIGLDYHRWDICRSACRCGESKGIAVYEALREPISKYFGSEFYDSMVAAAKYLKENDED